MQERQDTAELEAIIAAHPKEAMLLQLAPENIDLFNKIIEAYDNTALLSTLDPQAAKLALWLTADTLPLVNKLLRKLPFPVVLWSDYQEKLKAGDMEGKEDSR